MANPFNPLTRQKSSKLMDVDPGMHHLGNQSRHYANPPTPTSATRPSHETCWPGASMFPSQESVSFTSSADLIPDIEAEDDISSSQMSVETTSTEEMIMPGTRATTPVPQTQGLQRMQSIRPLGPAISIDPRPAPPPLPPPQPSADALSDFLQKHLTLGQEAQTQQFAALASMAESMREGMAALAQEARLLREETQRANAAREEAQKANVAREEAQKAAAARARPLRPSAGKRTRVPRHPQ